jgi:superfamily II DNA/RNA helicase
LLEDGFEATVLTGRVSPASRHSAAGEGRSAAIIIATDAALEGNRLPQVSEVIHYDVPLDPSRLHERLLSVGDRERQAEHVFLIPEEPESDQILSGLLEKAAQIDAALGGIGQVLE